MTGATGNLFIRYNICLYKSLTFSLLILICPLTWSTTVLSSPSIVTDWKSFSITAERATMSEIYPASSFVADPIDRNRWPDSCAFEYITAPQPDGPKAVDLQQIVITCSVFIRVKYSELGEASIVRLILLLISMY